MSQELPPGWIRTTLGEICLPVDKTDPRDAPQQEFDYIDIGGVQSGTGRIQGTKRIRGDEAPSRARQVVHSGDVVLSTVRTYQRKTAIVPQRLENAIASTGFAVLRPAEGVNSQFLLHQVLSDEFVEQLNVKQTGTSYPAVRDKDVRNVPFKIAPLGEQERIVAAIEEHFSRLDAVETVLRSNPKIEALRRSILQEAFSGRLVSQNPADESASLLLKRIHAT